MDRLSQRAEPHEPAEPVGVGVASAGTAGIALSPPSGPKRPRRASAATDSQRCEVRDYCHTVLHARAGVEKPALLRPQKPSPESRLTPRMIETMNHLLRGDSEKQIAGRLRISRHTVHVYVKQLYRRYNVNSKGELFADWVRRGGTLARHS